MIFSVTRLGDLLDFGQLYKAFGNINLPKSLTFLGNFYLVTLVILDPGCSVQDHNSLQAVHINFNNNSRLLTIDPMLDNK